MPEYKLVYFNTRGHAEIIRWIFAYGGIPYTDDRMGYASWPDRATNLPYGRVPALIIGDEILSQTLAIARYVAKEAGLVPEDNLAAALCDACCDTIYEVMTEVYKVVFSMITEEAKKQTYKEEVFPKTIAPVLTSLNKSLGEKEWFITDKVTWADLMIAQAVGEIHQKIPDMFEEYPNLVKHLQKVRALPKIKEYLDTAPETEY